MPGHVFRFGLLFGALRRQKLADRAKTAGDRKLIRNRKITARGKRFFLKVICVKKKKKKVEIFVGQSETTRHETRTFRDLELVF